MRGWHTRASRPTRSVWPQLDVRVLAPPIVGGEDGVGVRVNDRAGDPVPFRLVIYERILLAAQAQRSAVEDDDLDGFQTLLEERERLLVKVESLNQDLGDQDRERAATLIRRILDADRETERTLSERISRVGAELGSLSHGRGALSAYGYATRAAGSPARIDRAPRGS